MSTAQRGRQARPGVAAANREPSVDLAVPEPGLPVSFFEVRIGPGRVEVVEFYSHGRSAELREALGRLGLLIKEEFDSPCG